MKSFGKKNGTVRGIESRYGLNIEEILRKLFVDEDKSHMAIASELGVTYLTVVRWLDRAGVRSRKIDLEEVNE